MVESELKGPRAKNLTWTKYFDYCVGDLENVLTSKDQYGLQIVSSTDEIDIAADLMTGTGVQSDFTSSEVHLVGHSLGGMVAMEFAMMNPRYTKSMTLVHTSPEPISTFEFFGWVPGMTWGMRKLFASTGKTAEQFTDALAKLLGVEREEMLWTNSDEIKNKLLELFKKYPDFLRKVVLGGASESVVEEVLRDVRNTDTKTLLYSLFAIGALHIRKKVLGKRG